MNLSDIAADHESWFYEEASHLEPDVAIAVREALKASNRRHIWLALNSLREKFKLPVGWEARISEYYDVVF